MALARDECLLSATPVCSGRFQIDVHTRHCMFFLRGVTNGATEKSALEMKADPNQVMMALLVTQLPTLRSRSLCTLCCKGVTGVLAATRHRLALHRLPLPRQPHYHRPSEKLSAQRTFIMSSAGTHPQELTGPRVVTEEHHARVEDELAAVARHHVDVVGETAVGWVGAQRSWQELDEARPPGTRAQRKAIVACR